MNIVSDEIPVIAIDGPSASGKGTVAHRVAKILDFHYLDSGALYRLVAFSALRQSIALTDETALTHLAEGLSIRFFGGRAYLSGQDVSELIRHESVSTAASQIAVMSNVRRALFERQRRAQQSPGLVADGRDMTSVIFPEATLKIYLTADVHVRAQRRYAQLIGRDMAANLDAILADLKLRDERDMNRQAAPLRQTKQACLLDTSQMTIDDAVGFVLSLWEGAA